MSSEETKNMNAEEVIKTETDGFDSLIPENLFKKVLETMKAVDELNDEVVAFNKQLENQSHQSDYQMFQYVTFLEFVGETHKNIHCASQIHSVDKKYIDECAEERRMSPEIFMARIMLSRMFDMMSE